MYGTDVLSQARSEEANMSQSVVEASSEVPVTERTGSETINTRFGKITISYDHPLHLEKGLLGMPESRYFCITEFPVKKFPRFQLMQSLEDHELSFIVMPLPIQNSIIKAEDILETAKDLKIDETHLSLMLIVNVYREANYVRMSVNARAPIFVDSTARKAEQCVLRNNQYMVRHMLSNDDLGVLD